MEKLLGEDPNLISGCVHREILVFFKTKECLALAEHLRMPINLAWSRLRRGRAVKRISYKNQTILLLTLDPTAQQVGTVIDEATLSDALEAEGIGRVSVDPYELKIASKLMAMYGKTID